MGRIIQLFSKKQKNKIKDVNRDFTELLQEAVSDLQQLQKEGDTEIIADPEAYVRQKINTFLLDEKIMDPELFRCALYISAVIAKMFSTVPESYYASDYCMKGHEENDPFVILRGADFCFLLCSFFPGRGNRRMMKTKDYFHMGVQMYFSFYAMTQNVLGVCMGNNFSDMVEITQKSMEIK